MKGSARPSRKRGARGGAVALAAGLAGVPATEPGWGEAEPAADA